MLQYFHPWPELTAAFAEIYTSSTNVITYVMYEMETRLNIHEYYIKQGQISIIIYGFSHK